MNAQPQVLRALYQDADDFFVLLHGYAPGTPSAGRLTLNSGLNQLLEYLDTVAQNESDQTARQWLDLSWKEVLEAKAAFERKDHREGRTRLEIGEMYLTNALAKRPMTPDQAVEGSNSGRRIHV
jgi:hypothetical protein